MSPNRELDSPPGEVATDALLGRRSRGNHFVCLARQGPTPKFRQARKPLPGKKQGIYKAPARRTITPFRSYKPE